MRILLIDDDEDLRNLLSRYIRGQWPDAQIDGYDPLERDLPGAGFPLGSYDVVVLDYMLAEDPQAARRLPQDSVPHRRRQRDHRRARDEGGRG
jgi:DNA-binding response OmpR family regulator